MVAVVDKWLLFGGGGQLRFDYFYGRGLKLKSTKGKHPKKKYAQRFVN